MAAAQTPRWTRPLLPGDLVEGHPTSRSTRDWIVDLLMFLFAAVVGIFVLGTTWHDHSDLTLVLDIVAGVVSFVLLWWRRSHPTAVAGVAVSLSAFSGLAAGPGTAALFTAAIRSPRRDLAWLTAAAFASTATYPLFFPDNGGGWNYFWQVALGAIINGLVIGWGLFVRARRALIHSLRERAEQAESGRELEVAHAREAERRRIAREMHDVLAHRVSLVSLHAGALEFRPDASPEEIASAAAVIRAAARDALEELRDVIGVLREEDVPDGAAPEPPQPVLDDVPSLVAESRAAGMKIDFATVVVDELPATVGRTAYRIVQEGLTNARKHAPGAAVAVAVERVDGPALVVSVVSRRTVRGGDGLPGSGTGLIGLSERVALVGGTLEHGFGASGDFVLRATLPW